MQFIKKILLSWLGEKKYLSLLAGTFQALYKKINMGRSYQDIYFLRKLVSPGDYCADIGAHLGYYTFELSALAGKDGKIIAVEPMTKFNQTLKNLLKKKGVTNVDLKQAALGGEGEFVEMGIPQVGNMKKFAYARVMQTSTHLDYVETERVQNLTGDQLLLDLPRLDFIKCDVEGLELRVFGSMKDTLQKFRPVLLCELGDKADRIALFETLQPLGYQVYLLKDHFLHLLDVYGDEKAISHNHYFIPAQRLPAFQGVIR